MSWHHELLEKALWNFIIPVAALFAIRFGAQKFADFMKTLWVEGESNQWVIIMRNGTLVKAGIGLKTFKGPFDQVAMFPAKVHRAEFSTEQITKEMQGVKVSGMLVWTILYTGEGPFTAYKNLGSDLASARPHTANESLVSMASAIVRNCIANSTIHQMLTDRDTVRNMLKKDMFEVVKGWGVWIETFEVTGVTISSQRLFQDLQTNFREKVRQDAEICKMQFGTEIKEIRTKMDQKQAVFRRQIDQQKNEYTQKVNIEIEKENETF
jgi:regulator of protease activity HflC (stomatin/prohibitin superfamily)